MTNRTYDSNKIKAELSCRVVKTILFYLQDRYDREAIENFIEETGLDMEFLENENNWVSFDYYNQLLNKLVEFTNNPRAPFEVGYYVLSKESYGFLYSILSVLKLFGSPKMAYKQISEQASVFNNIGKLDVLESGINTMTMRVVYSAGYQQTKLNCLAIQGQLAYIPGFWGLPPAEIEELKCQAEGDDSCVYKLKWKPVKRNELFILGGLFLLFIGLLLLFFYQPVPWVHLKDLIITALGFLGIYSFVWLRKYQKIIEENKKLNVERSKALEESLESIKNEYRNLQTANQQIREEAEKLSILKDIAEQINNYEDEKETIVGVIKIILDRIGFDRGYCLIFNRKFKLLKLPEFIYREGIHSESVVIDYSPEDWEKVLAGLARERNIAFGDCRFIQFGTEDYESLIMPVIIGDTYQYFFIFDYCVTLKKVNPEYRQFFITVSNQLQVALNRVFAADSAKTIISSIPSCIAIFNLESRIITFYNESFKNEISVIQMGITGSDILDAIGIKSPESRERFIQQVVELPLRNFVEDEEMTIGSQILGYTLFVLPEISGRKKEGGIIMKDITSQKDMKEQLFRAEKMAALGTLVSGVAHEINNPLYGILGNAEIIRDEAASKEIKEYAETIIDFTVRASDIVKDLSSYSRSMRDEKLSYINLNDIMDEALRIVSYSKNFIDIKVEKNFSDIPPVFALRGELQQIYINLFNNAIDAMKGKGTLTLISRPSDGLVQTSVGDTGGGIPAEYLSKIFDPFFTTKETGKGTGLGLSIVYRLVTKYEGIISVHSEKDKGTTFDIKFIVKGRE